MRPQLLQIVAFTYILKPTKAHLLECLVDSHLLFKEVREHQDTLAVIREIEEEVDSVRSGVEYVKSQRLNQYLWVRKRVGSWTATRLGGSRVLPLADPIYPNPGSWEPAAEVQDKGCNSIHWFRYWAYANWYTHSWSWSLAKLLVQRAPKEFLMEMNQISAPIRLHPCAIGHLSSIPTRR